LDGSESRRFDYVEVALFPWSLLPTRMQLVGQQGGGD
jgi:hypothetical protein